MAEKERLLLLTSECPMYPPNLSHVKPPLPLPQLSDADVDSILELFVLPLRDTAPVPKTQFGRRAAVMAYVALQRSKA